MRSDYMTSSHVPMDTVYSPLWRSRFLPHSDVSMYQVWNDSGVDEGTLLSLLTIIYLWRLMMCGCQTGQ